MRYLFKSVAGRERNLWPEAELEGRIPMGPVEARNSSEKVSVEGRGPARLRGEKRGHPRVLSSALSSFRRGYKREGEEKSEWKRPLLTPGDNSRGKERKFAPFSLKGEEGE